jgi:hypothetical protein
MTNDERREALLRRLPSAAPSLPDDDEHVDDGVLVAWRAGRLDEPQTASVDRHLSDCRPCRALALELSVPVPDSLVRTAVELGTARSRPRPTFAPYAAVAGLLAAAALAVVFLTRPPSEGQGPVQGWQVRGPLGGLADARSADDDRVTHQFAPGAILRVLVEPGPNATRDAEVEPYVVDGEGRLRAATGLRLERGPTGIVRLSGTVSEVFSGRIGSARLAVVLRPRGGPGLSERSLEQARSNTTEAQWFVLDLEIVPPP